MAFFQPAQILVDCISRSAVPVAVCSGHRRGEHIQAALLASEIPPLRRKQMLIQGARIVLREYRHLLHVGIGHIAQGKIYAAVTAGDRHG